MSKKPTLTLNNVKKDYKNIPIVKTSTSKDSVTSQKDVKSSQETSDNKKSTNLNTNDDKTKKQNLISEEEYLAILSYMQGHYPKCFTREPPLQPLALGIHNQLFAVSDLPFSRMKIRKFLRRYTNSKKYQKILIVGNERIGLDGNPTSKILEEEVNHLKWRKLQAKKKAEAIKKANHDSLIKKAMENPISAAELLTEYLPTEFKEFVDLNTLKIEKESHIEDSLKTRFSDIVYSAKTKTEDPLKSDNAFIYLMIEHQSSPDYFIALRLLKYSLLLLERHAKKRDKLPVILPMVLYNGTKKYFAPKNLWQLFSHPELAKKAMSSDYSLIDLNAMSDEDIDYEKHLSFLLYTMKHIHDRDMLAMLKEAMQRCKQALIIDKGQDYVHTKLILWYTDSKVPAENKQLLEQLIVDNLPKEDKDNIMKTIADTYIEEGMEKGMVLGMEKGIEKGIEKGREEGIKQTAINMLKQNLDNSLISSVTGLATEDILKIKNKM